MGYGPWTRLDEILQFCRRMEYHKLHPGQFEPMCSLIGQVRLFNREGTEFNIILGLCVGQDSLSYRNSEACVTTLVAKDRVLAHNPCGTPCPDSKCLANSASKSADSRAKKGIDSHVKTSYTRTNLRRKFFPVGFYEPSVFHPRDSRYDPYLIF